MSPTNDIILIELFMSIVSTKIISSQGFVILGESLIDRFTHIYVLTTLYTKPLTSFQGATASRPLHETIRNFSNGSIFPGGEFIQESVYSSYVDVCGVSPSEFRAM